MTVPAAAADNRLGAGCLHVVSIERYAVGALLYVGNWGHIVRSLSTCLAEVHAELRWQLLHCQCLCQRTVMRGTWG